MARPLNDSSLPGSKDIISDIKASVTHVKTSLANVMKVASESLDHQMTLESGSIPPSAAGQLSKAAQFNTALEEFYSHCYKLQQLLTLASESAAVSDLSCAFSPTPVLSGGADKVLTTTQSYDDFLTATRHQVNVLQKVQEILNGFAARLDG